MACELLRVHGKISTELGSKHLEIFIAIWQSNLSMSIIFKNAAYILYVTFFCFIFIIIYLLTVDFFPSYGSYFLLLYISGTFFFWIVEREFSLLGAGSCRIPFRSSGLYAVTLPGISLILSRYAFRLPPKSSRGNRRAHLVCFSSLKRSYS